MHTYRSLPLAFALLLSTAAQSPAGSGKESTTRAETVPAEPISLFSKGRIEVQSLTGAAFSISTEPTLNHTLSIWSLGIMLNEVSCSGFLRGNSELLVEGYFGSVLSGPGDYLGGAGLKYRYNFVQPDTRWVPYVQVGGGCFVSDIHRDDTQSILSQEWGFNMQAAVGLRYLLNDSWSLSMESGFRRVLDFHSSGRGDGLDSLTVMIGFSRYF